MFLNILGGLFDFIQTAINISDITTDFLVTIEFYQKDRMVFFGLVLTTIILSGFISSIVFAIRSENLWCKGMRPSEWYHWCGIVLLLFPISPLLPVINYVLCLCNEKYRDEISIKQVNWGVADKNNNKDEKTTTKDEFVSSPPIIDAAAPDAEAQREKQRKEKEEKEKQQNKPDSGDGGASAEMFSESVSPQHKKLGLLDNAVTSRAASFMFYNINCVAESVPNAIIQMISISLSPEGATTIQIVSLLLSLVSVAAKSFQLARSATTAAFFAKIFYFATDLFKLAFVMSAILSTSGPSEISVFGSDTISIPYLCYAWIIIKIFVLSVTMICAIALFIRVIQDADDCEDRCLKPLAMIVGFVLCAIPAAIIQETVFLSVIIMFNAASQPDFSNLPFMTLLHEFLWTNDSSKEIREVVNWEKTFDKLKEHGKYICDKPEEPKNPEELVDEDGEGGNTLGRFGQQRQQGLAPAQRRRMMTSKAARRMQIANGVKPPNYESTLLRRLQQPLLSSSVTKHDSFFSRARHVALISTFFHAALPLPMLRAPFALWTKTRTDVYNRLLSTIDGAFVTETQKKLLDPSQIDDLEYTDVLPSYQVSKTKFANKFSCTDCCTRICDAEIEVLIASVAVIASALGGLFAFVFPIIYAALYFSSFTVIMQICWYAWASSLFLSIVLTPGLYHYHITCEVFKNHIKDPLNIHIIVDSYFSIPINVISQAIISDSVIPSDAVEKHVLPFLDPRAVGLYGIVNKDFKQVHQLFDTIVQKRKAEDEACAIAMDDTRVGGDGNDNEDEELKELRGHNKNDDDNNDREPDSEKPVINPFASQTSATY